MPGARIIAVISLVLLTYLRVHSNLHAIFFFSDSPPDGTAEPSSPSPLADQRKSAPGNQRLGSFFKNKHCGGKGKKIHV